MYKQIINIQKQAPLLYWEVYAAGNPLPSARVKSEQTCWEAHHKGEKFDGVIQPFGTLFWYLNHRRTHPMMRRAAPGFFWGGRANQA